MNTKDEAAKIKKIEKLIIDEANHNKDKILYDAKQQAEETYQSRTATIKEKYAEKIKLAEAQSTQKYSQSLSEASLDAKRAILNRREELMNSLFSEVKDEILTFTKTDDYKKMLDGFLASATDGVDRPFTVTVKSSDENYIRSSEILRNKTCEITVSDDIELGGLIVSYDNIEIDECLDHRFKNKKEELIATCGMCF